MSKTGKQILDMQPVHKLYFKGYYNNFAHVCLRLMNPSESRSVEFQVTASSPDNYCIDKPRGTIEPERNAYVHIIMLILEDYVPLNFEKHSFIVKSWYPSKDTSTKTSECNSSFTAKLEVQPPEIILEARFKEWRIIEAAQANVILGTELIGLRKEIRNISRKSFLDKRKTLNMLEKQIDKFEKFKEQSNQTATLIKNQNNGLKDELEKLLCENSFKDKELAELHKQSVYQEIELKKEIEKLNSEKMFKDQNILEEANKCERLITQTRQTTTKLEAQISELKKELSKQLHNNSYLDQKVQEQEDKYERQIKQFKQNETQLEVVNSELNDKVAKLLCENSFKDQEIAKLREQIVRQDEYIKRLRSTFSKVFKEPIEIILFPSIIALGFIFAGVGAAYLF